MALGLDLEEKKGGNFLPVLKFDAKSGDFMVLNREPGTEPGTWEKSEIELKTPFKAVIDFDKMEKGWLCFKPGAVNLTMVGLNDRMPDKPSEDHKIGIRFKIFLKEHGLREFANTSKNVLRAVNSLHDEFVKQVRDNPGKMPVVEVSGVETVKIQTKENGELRFKVPKWKIAAWADPPGAFSGQEEKAEAPKPKPMPAAKPADDDEF